MEVRKFTPETLRATREAWLASSEVLEIPPIEYEMNLDWAEKRIDYANANGDSFAYGIFSADREPACALLDIVYRQMRGPDVGWLKMMTLKFSPDFTNQGDDEALRLLKVLEIYAEAIIGTVKLTSQHAARVVKLYSRSDSQFRLLLALNERLKNSEGFQSQIQGRWLVLTSR